MEIMKFLLDYPPTWAVLLMVFDIVTGYYQAWCNHTVNSQKLKAGWSRKGAEMLYLMLIITLNFALQHFGFVPADYEELIALMSIDASSAYLILKELTSVCENLCKANPELAAVPFMQHFAVNNKHHDID